MRILKVLLLIIGLASDSKAENYHRAIIFVPGFKGSSLIEIESGRTIWISLPEAIGGDRSLAISHPDYPFTAGLRLKPGHVLRSVPIIPRIFERALYGDFLDFLKDEFGKNSRILEVSYDWRRSNAEVSHKIQELLGDLVKENFQDITVIAHSMGGLALGHALNEIVVLPSSLKVAFIGTPFGGVPSIIGDLSNESRSGLFNSNLLSQRAFCSFDSSYEFLPLDRTDLVVGRDGTGRRDLTDVEIWKRDKLGCFSIEAGTNHSEYESYLRSRLESTLQFQHILNKPLNVAPSSRIHFLNILGTGIPSSDGCIRNLKSKNRPLNCYESSLKIDGDGVVTAASARLPHSFTKHENIQLEFPNVEHLQLIYEDGPRNAIKNLILSESAEPFE
jgi:hypothetical protein